MKLLCFFLSLSFSILKRYSVALKLEDKRAIVAEVAEIAAKASSAIAAEYRGLTVGEMTELRKEARKASVYLRVVRNTLARRALENTDFACMQDTLTGPLILAFSMEDPGAAARVISAFAKDNEKLVAKTVSIGGKLLSGADIEVLAKMPTYEQAISMLMSVIQAPISKLVRTLAEPQVKLVRTLAAVQEQKEAAQEQKEAA
ncbi:MAG: 50S ribosomal protein L10 [Gammaproteobacteria bacterium]|nr:50S ribosomal protein L10 [Gammaproteobacteria bacterium]